MESSPSASPSVVAAGRPGSVPCWKGTYQPQTLNDRRAGGSSANEISSSFVRIGIHKDHADALEALLTHYPWIVYMGFTFWRKMLVIIHPSLLKPQERENIELPRPPLLSRAAATKSGARRGADVVPAASSGGHHHWTHSPRSSSSSSGADPQVVVDDDGARQLGVSGDLIHFCKLPWIPQEILSSRRPLSIAQLKEIFEDAHDDLRAQLVEKEISAFILGLISSDQADALHAMVRSGMLLSQKDWWTFDDTRDGTLLHNAARVAPTGSTISKMLIQHGSSVTTRSSKNGAMPIHAAAYRGDMPLARLLVQHHALIDVKDYRQGWTPLLYAAQEGHRDMVAFLLDKGANMNLSDDVGWTVLHLSTTFNNDTLDTVKLFLQRGIAVDRKQKDGFTPLMSAASRGNLEVVKLLTQSGADVDLKCNIGRTACSIASTAKPTPHMQVVEYLSTKGSLAHNN